MQRVMLYFGSFNPIHKGHIALAEYVVEQGLCDLVTLIVSPQSPYKSPAELAPELDRFEMAELACAGSKYPDQIKPSVVEFLLPKPSYTIETLRYLEQISGGTMEFSILMGADQIEGLKGWREWEEIVKRPIYVYPRGEEACALPYAGMTLLEGAPLHAVSATEIRRRIAEGEKTNELLHPKVAWHIQSKGLYKTEKDE
ncbi:MAG: nicotinate-nicotinamide nucleotide adenylyltransferase [Alistipes sp.]|nr:nicotinate-nicotinamide nucleotide adenylyltransferase [Alistipes sp.]